MKVHLLGAHNRARYGDLLEENYKLRHRIFVELQGWEGIRRPDGRDVDAFDGPDATHILVTDDGELVGGSRFNCHDGPTLLQTVFPGLVTEPFPAPPALGADWTRFYVRPDRREGRRRAPESAALFCTMMEYALLQGYSFITFVSTIYMVELGVSMGLRIVPLGAPANVDGKPTLAAWIEVSETALANLRRATGISRVLLPLDDLGAGVPRPVASNLV